MVLKNNSRFLVFWNVRTDSPDSADTQSSRVFTALFCNKLKASQIIVVVDVLRFQRNQDERNLPKGTRLKKGQSLWNFWILRTRVYIWSSFFVLKSIDRNWQHCFFPFQFTRVCLCEWGFFRGMCPLQSAKEVKSNKLCDEQKSDFLRRMKEGLAVEHEEERIAFFSWSRTRLGIPFHGLKSAKRFEEGDAVKNTQFE